MKFDVVIIGGGLAGMTCATMLQQAGFNCAVVAKGKTLHRTDPAAYLRSGGVLFKSDAAVLGTFSSGKLLDIRTEKLGSTRLEADWFVLATGKFASGGLSADMGDVRETVFGAEVEYDPDRSRWADADFYAPQPFLSFGVKADAEGRLTVGGGVVANLFGAGEILSGIDGTAEGAEEKIAQSARKAAENIIHGIKG